MLSVTQKTGQLQASAVVQQSQRRPGSSSFGGVLSAEQGGGRDAVVHVREVQRGDTLIGMVKQQANRFGVTLGDSEAMRQALQVAKINGISNPNLIHPGQIVDFSTLTTGLQARVSSADGFRGEIAKSHGQGGAPSTQDTLRVRQPTTHARDGGVLSQTLERAVDKGYITRAEQGQVHARILKLADDLNFDPDDFAHVAMMESDGLNPKASNGQCHGIIQFCEGPGRGAASVNKAGQAASIRDMSVLEQLDLVETYFRDVGLGGSGQKLRLDDLYLSVLTPAARVYQAPHLALPIRGTQAAALHVDGERARPITRHSIVQGLILNSQDRLAASRMASEAARAALLTDAMGPAEGNLTGDDSPAAKQRQDLAAYASQASKNAPDGRPAGFNESDG